MTVIESQAMDMTAMKPPVGSVPVAMEFVGTGEFSAKVRYTGSVAPYNEQDIYPRVDGWLIGLKVCNGSRVRAGQLLAVLDSPDIQNKLSEATYGHIAALKEIPVVIRNTAENLWPCCTVTGESSGMVKQPMSHVPDCVAAGLLLRCLLSCMADEA